jgi:hypothetical protein
MWGMVLASRVGGTLHLWVNIAFVPILTKGSKIYLFSKRDIHGYKVSSNYIKKFFEQKEEKLEANEQKGLDGEGEQVRKETPMSCRKQWQWRCWQGDYSSAERDQNNEIFVNMWFVIYVTLNLFVYLYIVSSLFMRTSVNPVHNAPVK